MSTKLKNDTFKFAITLPNREGETENVWFFNTRKQARKAARERFGADGKGRILLVTKLPKTKE
jgi:hypothetical protein